MLFLDAFFFCLIDQQDHYYTYRNYGLYLLKYFVVAFTNVCTVKLAQLHSLIRLELAQATVCLSG